MPLFRLPESRKSGDFKKARQLVRALPSKPKAFSLMKEGYLDQIDQAQKASVDEVIRLHNAWDRVQNAETPGHP